MREGDTMKEQLLFQDRKGQPVPLKLGDNQVGMTHKFVKAVAGSGMSFFDLRKLTEDSFTQGR